MPLDKKRIEELRLERMKLAETRGQEKVRASYGVRLVAIISHAMGQALALDDFDEDTSAWKNFESPQKVWEAKGLVTAHIADSTVLSLLSCFGKKVGKMSGRIGFDDLRYLGLARIENLEPSALLRAVDESRETLLFFVDNPEGVIFIEYEGSSGYEPFSVVVQGDGLVQALAGCFKGISFEKSGGG
jgi:hypothetical protein